MPAVEIMEKKMKADLDDAPRHIKRKRSNSGLFFMALAIGAAGASVYALTKIQPITIDITKLKSAFETQKQDESRQATEVNKTEPTLQAQIENEQAKGESTQKKIELIKSLNIEKPAKQTSFNTQNYKPKDSINIINAPEFGSTTPSHYAQAEKQNSDGTSVTIIKQAPSKKDTVCGRYRDGSIEQRECRAHIGLNYRD